MSRKSKLEIKLEKLWNDIGTIYYRTYEELGMMLEEFDPGKVHKLIKDLDNKKRIYRQLNDDNSWAVDYIRF